jgi:hypothetical protein
MVVVAASVLVLNDELRPILALGDNVDPPSSASRNLRFSNGGEIDVDLGTNRVKLLGEQRCEVGRLASPCLAESPELESRHRRHGYGLPHPGIAADWRGDMAIVDPNGSIPWKSHLPPQIRMVHDSQPSVERERLCGVCRSVGADRVQ